MKIVHFPLSFPPQFLYMHLFCMYKIGNRESGMQDYSLQIDAFSGLEYHVVNYVLTVGRCQTGKGRHSYPTNSHTHSLKTAELSYTCQFLNQLEYAVIRMTPVS